MNKKFNTLLFVLVATLFNIIVAVTSFILLLIVYARFIFPLIPAAVQPWSFSILFLGSIAVSIFVYRIVLKVLIEKIDIEKYFDPIFTRKYKKR
jgi:hypothetical protein